METKIAVLSREVANQIAAGEVVERPASILKELLENAVDAGATDLMIELEQGGCRSIRVVDNGEGMDGDDLALAFQRHATSKIRHIDDIFHIVTYGFRGEALPSIASIARVEMISRKKGQIGGNRIVVDGGRTEPVMEIGCPEGTSVRVTQIFDHVPARKKFLKAVATEQAACMDIVVRVSMSHPEIRLKVVSNGRTALQVPVTTGISERLALILGEDTAAHMTAVSGERNGIRLTGFITRPEFSRANTKGYHFFVNGRFIRDNLISHAVMTAYRRVIPEKRYPVLVFFIDVATEAVDINVHPAKTEIRFQNPRDVYECVVETIVATLAVSPVAMPMRAAELQENIIKTDYHQRVEEALKRYTLVTGGKRPVFGQTPVRQEPPRIPELWPEKRDVPDAVQQVVSTDATSMKFSELSYLGQIGATYLVFSAGDRLVLMDQHAAHERVLFEKIRSAAVTAGDFRQPLLVPEVLNLSPSDYCRLINLTSILAEIGIEIEPFGGNAVVVKSFPSLLANLPVGAFVMDLLGEMQDEGGAGATLAFREKLFAVMACKAAVKANHILSEDEVQGLCVAMDHIPFNATCPHGRPVYLIYSPADLQKLFKRT
ncbi:MAG: DNA mismatch repair endonuclease MutL [Syntrophaceae bacterium]|nr:DNA mismatch repair endonuclease MutL [Syntrophaceae bacterium]